MASSEFLSSVSSIEMALRYAAQIEETKKRHAAEREEAQKLEQKRVSDMNTLQSALKYYSSKISQEISERIDAVGFYLSEHSFGPYEGISVMELPYPVQAIPLTAKEVSLVWKPRPAWAVALGATPASAAPNVSRVRSLPSLDNKGDGLQNMYVPYYLYYKPITFDRASIGTAILKLETPNKVDQDCLFAMVTTPTAVFVRPYSIERDGEYKLDAIAEDPFALARFCQGMTFLMKSDMWKKFNPFFVSTQLFTPFFSKPNSLYSEKVPFDHVALSVFFTDNYRNPELTSALHLVFNVKGSLFFTKYSAIPPSLDIESVFNDNESMSLLLQSSFILKGWNDLMPVTILQTAIPDEKAAVLQKLLEATNKPDDTSKTK